MVCRTTNSVPVLACLSGYNVPIDTLPFMADSCRMTQPDTATAATTLYAKLLAAAETQRLYEADIRSRGPLAAIDWYVAVAA